MSDPTRRLTSWITAFEDYTSNTESPRLFRKWMGIATIAAVLEQKVWIQTSSPMYPNLYTFLVGPPGAGKSRIMKKARELMEELPDPFIAPTSVNTATLVDQLKDSKRLRMNMPSPPLEYNSMVIMVGELGTFIHKYEDDMIAMLSDMYDVEPYGQRRRGKDLKIQIPRPQLNMIIGVQPSALMKFMPEIAWEQGFSSRIMFVYGNDKKILDDFAESAPRSNADLIHDLRIINDLIGQFRPTEAYRNAVNLWRDQDEKPKPEHPRLTHYCSRRKAHLYRLSMISAIDRGNVLVLDKADFNRALGWLLELEAEMPKIFDSVSDVADAMAAEEVEHFIMEENLRTGKMVPQHKIVELVRKKVRGSEVMRFIHLIKESGRVSVTADRRGMLHYKYQANGPAEDPTQEIAPLN